MLAGALELFLVALGLIYFVGTTASGLRVIRSRRREAHPRRRPRPARRRGPSRLSRVCPAQQARVRRWLRFLWHKAVTADQPVARAAVSVDPDQSVVYFIVPCLNEERVIEDSLRNLLADPRGIVVVVDDASDDRTARIAAGFDPDRVVLVRRQLPDARQGKGPALNTGFARLLEDAAARGIAPSRVTVCVMDADGRLSEGAVDAVLPLFADERVGGVQLPVRIRRVKGSVLTLLQDLEFWGVCAVAQLGRIGSGTVSLGGNGQFTRLAALLELGDRPWRARLTEDLDLALALATAGWRLTSTPDAYVSQQGLPKLRALINQRTRWYQGHMQAGRWLPKLWSSRRVAHLSMLELTLYLLVPLGAGAAVVTDLQLQPGADVAVGGRLGERAGSRRRPDPANPHRRDLVLGVLYPDLDGRLPVQPPAPQGGSRSARCCSAICCCSATTSPTSPAGAGSSG